MTELHLALCLSTLVLSALAGAILIIRKGRKDAEEKEAKK